MTPTWTGIALASAVTLFAGGAAIDRVQAQASNPPAQQSDAKQKAAADKKNAAKQTEAQTGSGKAAPMSGFRPDPQTNY